LIHFLLGDDEEAIRQILSAQLTAPGYITYEVSTGDEVLRAVPAVRPDLIILDLGLPDIDGFEVIQRLRVSTKTPIIVLSVHAAESDKIAALDAGADHYLTKPCRLAHLDGASVQCCLEKRLKARSLNPAILSLI
jgi:two-component system, OmpR family, KDP operon response regulator KdpE